MGLFNCRKKKLEKLRIEKLEEVWKPTKEYVMSGGALWKKLTDAGLELPCNIFDANYYYVSLYDWECIFAEVIINMPKYVRARFDCDDFSLLIKSRVSELYHLNAVGIVLGDYGSRHAWNIFLSTSGLHYLEPQSGKIYRLDEEYNGEWVLI